MSGSLQFASQGGGLDNNECLYCVDGRFSCSSWDGTLWSDGTAADTSDCYWTGQNCFAACPSAYSEEDTSFCASYCCKIKPTYRCCDVRSCTCPAGKYLSSTSCYSCDSSCATCSGYGPSACTSCAAGKHLSSGKCVACAMNSHCASGFMCSSSSSTCVSITCSGSCATCSGTSSSSCASGKYLSSGSCLACDSSCVVLHLIAPARRCCLISRRLRNQSLAGQQHEEARQACTV